MLTWGQRRLVSFVNPQIRNFDAVDEQVDAIDGSKFADLLISKRALSVEGPNAELALTSLAA
jgi:hypothetical protein